MHVQYKLNIKMKTTNEWQNNINFLQQCTKSQECTDVTHVLGLQFNSDSTQCTTAPLGGGQCLMQLQKSQHEYICKCKEI